MLRLLFVATLAAAFLASQLTDAAEPAAAAKKPVAVTIWLVEVEYSKLQALGLDWNALAKPADMLIEKRAGKFDEAFLDKLRSKGLARVAGSPTVTSLSGRSASLTLGPEFKLDVTPKIVDERTIELSYRIDKDVAQTGQPKRRLVSAYSTEVEAGVVTCLSQTKARTRDAEGKVAETTMLVIAKATTLK